MKLVIKSGSRIIKSDDFSAVLVKKEIDEILKEHSHLCADCMSAACGDQRGIENVIVYSGIKTPERDYIFGCVGYRKRKVGYELIQPDVSHPKPYVPTVYSVVHPSVKQIVKRLK